jgi:hypothetical protein
MNSFAGEGPGVENQMKPFEMLGFEERRQMKSFDFSAPKPTIQTASFDFDWAPGANQMKSFDFQCRWTTPDTQGLRQRGFVRHRRDG